MYMYDCIVSSISQVKVHEPSHLLNAYTYQAVGREHVLILLTISTLNF